MRTAEFAPGLKADIYLPAGAEEATGGDGGARAALPVILWLHGGAWRVGDRTLAPDLQRYFADRGFAMVSIDYRLSGEAVFPAQLDDVRTAIRWVRKHAAEYGFDPDAIGLWGSSAGGHLAALAAVTADAADAAAADAAGMDAATTVQAVVDGYGAADLLAPDQDVPPTVGLLGGPVLERRDLAIAASPARHVTASAPPFLIMHGGADPLVPASQSVTLFEALAVADVPATLYVIDGFGHGFFNPVGGEELAGPPIDAGHLEADPFASATVRMHPPAQSGLAASGATPPPASFDLVESFFRTHLTRP